MSIETLLKVLSIMISGAGLTWAILSYYFKKADAFEKDKLKARAKIKELENEIAKHAIARINEKIEELKAQLDDHGQKFDLMSHNYDGVSKRVERTALLLDVITEDMKKLYREVTDNKQTHGNLYRGKWGKNDGDS